MNSVTLSRPATQGAHQWAELILSHNDCFTPELTRRAEAVLAQIVAARVGGACWAPHLPLTGRTVVFASADPNATISMLLRAIQHGSASRTLLVMRCAGRIGRAAKRLGVATIERPADPWPLVEQSDHVHASGDSEAALLAALLGKHVECLGPGPLSLTRDKARLVVAGFLLGTRYVDPFTGQPQSCEVFLDSISEMRRHRDANATISCCVGISFWKRRRVAAMLGGAKSPAFRKTARAAITVARTRGGGIAVWPSRAPAGLTDAVDVPIMRVEDGFVRSVGLGADFLPPLSLVLDQRGIYYDATGPSDLERLLSETAFVPAMLHRSAALRRRLVADRVTKYNLPSGSGVDIAPASRIILVPGQVADDRSVLLGGGGVGAGLDLLQRVRQQAPDAHIIYKPHPDVDAGHRLGAVPDSEIRTFADQIVRGGSIADLMENIHEVHTLTSLAGFEALLRGKQVTCYGQPFYAGWGLTTDLNPLARRTRRLTLDELIAGTMILYPRYIDPVTLLPCGPETVLDRLRDPALHRTGLLVMARRAQGRVLDRVRGFASAMHRTTEWKDAA